MKLVTTLLLAATCSAFALDDGPIFQCHSRCLLGCAARTHHGVDARYLQNYLDEFVFRFNRRKTPMAAFQTLLGLTTQRPHVSLKKMTEPKSEG